MLRFAVVAIVSVLLVIASFIGISIPISRAMVRTEENRRSIAVGAQVPASFPVVVVYRSQRTRTQEARIVYHRYLPEFLRGLPSYTFRVPAAESAKLNTYLAVHPSLDSVAFSEKPDPRFAAGRVSVREIDDGKQLLKVEGTWDDDRVNIGWYETDGHSITPTRYVTYFGPGVVLKALPISAAITVAVWCACFLLVRRFSRRSRIFRWSAPR